MSYGGWGKHSPLTYSKKESMDEQKINPTLRQEAIREVEKECSTNDPIERIKQIAAKFIEKQLDAFPYYCQVARMQNHLKWKELKETSNKGKYTDTYGWSASGDMKFEYEIPEELYLFMVNLVYKDFWEKENEKVYRTFMKRLMRGDDPMELLVWVKKFYGSNSQKLSVVNV